MAGRYFGIPFAATGDKTTTPDAVQPDGSVSYAEGFGFDYERPNTDPAYKPVPRDGMNGLFYDITEAVGIIQEQGVADWDADAAPYRVDAMARHDDIVWSSRVPNNNSTPGANGDWLPLYVGDIGQNVAVFTTAGVTNWSVPAVLQSGARKAHVTVVGGGGAGSRNNGESGSGGAGGGAALKTLSLTGVATVSVTVGAGGTPQASGVSTGGDGGASSFGTYCSATGGGGAPGAGGGGEGGIGLGGDVNLQGQGGSARANGIGSGVYMSGSGGSSLLGGGARGLHTSVQTAGLPGGYGGGGGGSILSINGGAGGVGIVIVRW